MNDHFREILLRIYEDNATHFDFIEDMSGGDCDCILHAVVDTIEAYNEGEL